MEEANEKRLIIVKQLPEFEEHLHLIKEEAEKRVADAMQMVVSEETVKTVKKVRAELNSEFSALEQRMRKRLNCIRSNSPLWNSRASPQRKL